MATDWNKLKVVDLRAELKRRELPYAGLKQELVNRLAASDAEREASKATEETTAQAEEQQEEPETTTEDSGQGTEPVEKVKAKEDEPSGASQPDATAQPADTRDVPQETKPTTQPIILTGAEPIAEEEVITQTEPTLSQIAEIQQDAQSRKRRSPSPPVLSQDVRKRARYATDDVPAIPDSAFSSADDRTNGHAAPEAWQNVTQSSVPSQNDAPAADHQDGDEMDVEQTGPRKTNGHATDKEEDEAATTQVPTSGPEQSDHDVQERAVAPSVHPATSALYIKNFMRPLRPAAVQDFLAELATPRSQPPDNGVIQEFYLDQIRTHALVVFTSVQAASRVRAALHDIVWPDESNRKALWVDFVPTDKVKGWIDTEQAEQGGRSGLSRWEVVYDQDSDGRVTASLEIAGPDTGRAPKPAAPAEPARDAPPPTGPSSSSTAIPTGPSRGIEGAPLGPRADRDRSALLQPGGGRFASPSDGSASGGASGSWQRSRAHPVITYRPVAADLARSRVANMHSFVARDPDRAAARGSSASSGQLNRYTFESGDAFVDRGKEVFIGIRPPHRERERQRERGLAAGGGGGGPEARRGGGAPTPPTGPAGSWSRGESYRGGGRSNFAPRSRLDGNPLPVYGGPPPRSGGGRWGGRDSYRDRW